MHSFFDQTLTRRGTSSVKWDLTELFLGYKDVVPFSVADMDFRSPPEVIDALTQCAQQGIFGYAARPEAFFHVIQQWFHRRYDWAIETSWIAPTPGVIPALHTAIRAYTSPGDSVVLLSPAYYPFFSIIAENGVRLVESRLVYDGVGYTIDIDDIDLKLRNARALLFCNPHNPVGRVWRQNELEQVAEVCLRHNIIIISDDIHCDLILDGTYTPIATLSEEIAQQTVTCASPSKTFNLSALHTAFAVIANPQLLQQFEREKQKLGYFFGIPFGDSALVAAYTYSELWLDSLLVYLRENLAYLVRACGKIDDVRVVKPEGTYLAWLDFRRTGLLEDQITQLLCERAGIGLERGSVFGDTGVGFQRLNFATSRQTLTYGVERMICALLERKMIIGS
jgi:cystathionine beta-lyase